MSIISMQKIAVIGLDTEKERLMSQLMDFGAVELIDQAGKFSNEIWSDYTTQDENQEQVAELETKINRAAQALDVIEKYYTGKKPLFKTRRAVLKTQFEDMAAENAQKEAESKVEYILGLNEKLHNITEKINKLDADSVSLKPWAAYDLPLEISETASTAIDMGVLPLEADTNELMNKLEKEIGAVVMRKCYVDKDMQYIAAISPNDLQEQVLTILKQYGFSATAFKGFEGTVADNLVKIQGEKDVLFNEYAEVEMEIASHSQLKEIIEDFYDVLTIQADKEKIRTKLLKTKRTFFIEGWIPKRCVAKATEILEQNQCYYVFKEPEEGEEVPVLMENKNFFVPYEAITEMYSLPDYHGFDPTSIFALFYACFFGMMLSDAGYGIVIAVACFVILKKYNLEGTTFKMIKLFFYCGIATIFWGAMFGGWFGDFVQVFSRTILNHEVEIKPIWFNPIDDPLTLLIFSLALGIIHIFIGMGIKAYMLIKDGHWFDAVCDVGFWYLVIIGIVAWLGGGSISPALTKVGMVLAIIGAVGLLLTGGRDKKGIGKVTGGLGSLYNITSYMSDILSYARLLALGLATGVIAQVVNTMGAMAGGGIKGAIVLMIAFVFGHAFNLAINALGAYIHSSRLQYIEFFGKFYEDGGEPFNPFRKNTKYIRITRED